MQSQLARCGYRPGPSVTALLAAAAAEAERREPRPPDAEHVGPGAVGHVEVEHGARWSGEQQVDRAGHLERLLVTGHDDDLATEALHEAGIVGRGRVGVGGRGEELVGNRRPASD